MFNLRLLSSKDGPPFNRQVPIFNWYYPNAHANYELLPNNLVPFLMRGQFQTRRRAAYLHIPFCQTICSFCPFTRGKYYGDRILQDYTQALEEELRLKQELMGRIAVDAIYVGGGTPSLLNALQIESLGKAIHKYLDTSALAEFTFELEVKSVTKEILLAMRKIGVNRVSFGVQTFSPRHRDLFSLDATTTQIEETAAMANELFEYTNVDMIYGMSGQTSSELLNDVHQAIGLGTTSVDFNILDNLYAQVRMHRMARTAGLQLLDAKQRSRYRRDIDDYFRAQGYCAINGYGYSRRSTSNETLIQHNPKFLYHDIVYGYHDDVVIGYGPSALTRLPGFNFYNHTDRAEYISRIRSGMVPWGGYNIGNSFEKGIVTFPFRGVLEKTRIPWDHVDPVTLRALEEAVKADLITEKVDHYELTKRGWLFYADLMYYLMPIKEKEWISQRIDSQIAAGHECEETSLVATGQEVGCLTH
jgi:coproporphyrinogen III oxidase-like Fe-S oxidoreductase